MNEDSEQPIVAEFERTLSELPNAELLAALDAVLLELERRLLRYAQEGHQLLHMADEGLILATRTRARLTQAQSAAAHTQGHLQILGVGDWSPRATAPGWSDDPRIVPDS